MLIPCSLTPPRPGTGMASISRSFRELARLRAGRVDGGHFEGGILGQHTFSWTFTPTHLGELAVVLPVHEQRRLVDLLAIARHDYRVWGCCTGAGQYVGVFANPLPVHEASVI